MRGDVNALFNSKTIKKFCTDIKITPAQKKAAYEWLELLENEQLEKETQNYFKFALIILKDLLGYPIKEDMGYEEGNVEFTFANKEGRKVICFEVKGAETRDLFSPQYRDKKEHSTPIKQTWDYMGDLNLDYGVATNYRHFVLIDKNKGTSKYHLFDFIEIKNNEDKIKEFIAIFSKGSVIDKRFVQELYNASVIEEKEFTKEFYKLFHETRLMLIREFQNNGASREESIHYAQLFLNRLIFIFFVEDTDKLPRRLFFDRILKILEAMPVTDHSKYVSETILSLFESLDKGAEIPIHIFGFDGGLFREKIPPNIYFKDLRGANFFKDVYQYSELKKQVKLDEFSEKVVRMYRGKLNPIISNILAMDSFDFATELNVNILGHIFEQSLRDLQYLKGETISKRKKEGIFYTPEYITDYIARHTIISYLSKNGATNTSDLIKEYSDNIDELEQKFKHIKILDPACGSGAFLIKAVDILLEIYKQIQAFKQFKGRYTVFVKGKKSRNVSEQLTLSKWNEENEARKIIENNIFGVDLNEESIEITKLSLFLKIASPNRKLIDLTQNVKTGNSVIDDKAIDQKAFVWKNEFPEIFKNGGFDIIIGNPPYVRVQFLDHKAIDWLKQNKETAYKRVDISTLFFELAKQILKNGGLVSFISSNQFLVTEYGRKTREFLLKQFRILSMVDYGDLRVFEDALTYVSIFTLKNDTPENFRYLRITDLEHGKYIDLKKAVLIQLTNLGEEPWLLGERSELQLVEKLKKHSKIGEIGNAGTGLFTGLDEILLLDKDTIKSLGIENNAILPVLRGSDPVRYCTVEPSKYVIYPYKLVSGKTIILDEDEFKNKYPNAYKYLLDNKHKLLERRDSRKTFGEKKNWYGLTRFGLLDSFRNEKIVTPGEVRDHKFTIDYSKSGFLNARVFSVIVKDENIDIKYVLALLNSKVVKFFLHNTAPLKQGGYFAYSSQFLNAVPVPSVSSSVQKHVINKVDSMFELQNALKDAKSECLYRLQSNLNIKITKRLSQFYLVEFSEFLNELSKQKVKLSLNEQDEWQKYFNEHKQQIAELQKKIKKVDDDIDETVYDIYGMSSEERKLIEENANQ